MSGCRAWYVRVGAKIRVLVEEGLTIDCIRHAMARFLGGLGGGGTRERKEERQDLRYPAPGRLHPEVRGVAGHRGAGGGLLQARGCVVTAGARAKVKGFLGARGCAERNVGVSEAL